MTSNPENSMTIKEFTSSPWIRVIGVLISVFITASGFVVVRAETSIKEKIRANTESIKDVKQDVDKLQDNINAIDKTQTEIITTLRFIKEATEEIKDDIKKLKR